MAFELPPLPWAEDALDPVISAQTISFHYGKHHKAYVDNLNKFAAGTEYENMPLEDVVKATAGDASKTSIFNNAAQVWNHSFFWSCMKPGGGGAPPAGVATCLNSVWGSYEKFAGEFKAAAVGRFGSGWAWLILDENNIPKIVSTPNAENPMAQGTKALLTCDVWEHAYYLDYQNRRPDFVQAFLDKLVNWDLVDELMSKP
jgi:superoxide dismutase, Fe-Mn family